jgi:hypothetical protein
MAPNLNRINPMMVLKHEALRASAQYDRQSVTLP